MDEVTKELLAHLSSEDQALLATSEEPTEPNTPPAETDEEPETDTEPPEEPAAKEDTEDEEEEGEKPDKVQRRIDKLTARAKTAEERAESASSKLAELEAELTQLREQAAAPAVVAAPTADNPLANVSTREDLDARVKTCMQMKRWCIENPDGGTVLNTEGKEVEIDPQAVRRIMADVEETLAVHAPARSRYLAERDSYLKEAKEVYPDMFTAGSEQQKMLNSLLKAWPEILRFPDAEMVLGDYIAGVAARRAKQTSGKPKERSSATLPPPVPKAAAPKTTAPKSTAPKPSISKVVESLGSEEALANYFASAN